MKILLVAAVWQELDKLICQFHATWDKKGKIFHCQQSEFHAKVIGVGMINAACMTTHFLSMDPTFDEIWMIGCCGSYQENIKLGDAIIATREINGDLGIVEDTGWQSPLNFPFSIISSQGKKYYHEFPCKTPKVERFTSEYSLHLGTLLSCSTVSGSLDHAQMLAVRYQALAENMEGAAVAQVSMHFQKPFVEIRGVSNIAGERNKSKWNFPKAMCSVHNTFFNICTSLSKGEINESIP